MLQKASYMKYSSEIVIEICKSVRAGCSHKDAAILSGVSESTYYRWLDPKDTTLPDIKKQEFRERIKKAELQCKAKLIRIIHKSAKTTWQSAAWLLERRYPEEYGVRQDKWQTKEDDGPLQVQIVEAQQQNSRSKNEGIEIDQ